jgi:hypothetical protein
MVNEAEIPKQFRLRILHGIACSLVGKNEVIREIRGGFVESIV